jgi:hypothetical protein
MYVNPFWMGVLLTIVSELVISIVLSLIRSHREDDDEDHH